LSPIKLWDNRVLPCSLVLNQDLQDFEDFLALGVGWYGACRSIKCKRKYPFILIADAMIAAAKY
jgi:hypothetical protein